MKKLKYLIVLVISLAFFSCASTQNQSLNDGNCKLKSQRLTFNDKEQPFDVLTFIKPNGEEVKYYFDISKFYGRF
jgi:hypothetical protein